MVPEACPFFSPSRRVSAEIARHSRGSWVAASQFCPGAREICHGQPPAVSWGGGGALRSTSLSAEWEQFPCNW